VDNSPEVFELDELYWFIERKAVTARKRRSEAPFSRSENRERTKTRENVYLMTMVSRKPRQIVGFDVALDKSSARIQEIVDSAYDAEKYCTDGYSGYINVVYPGEHIQNIHNKKDTYTVEGVNADLRHYIPLLARRSRCFARKLETLQAVVAVFVDAYNRFGIAKHIYRQKHPSGEIPFAVVDFL